MQQVNKKHFKLVLFVSFISIFFIMGCSTKNEYPKSVKYFDDSITKDQLLNAAKRVFYLADKEAFIIDAYRNDLNVTKTKASYKFYSMDIQNDHFNFNVEDQNLTKPMKATLSIYRSYGIDEKDIDYLVEDSRVYNLFWDRVSYLLGKSKEWNSCSFYKIDGFLCDRIDIEDTSAMKKDMIDLSVVGDQNSSKELVKIQTSYSIPNKRDNNSRSDDLHILRTDPNNGGFSGDNNATFESYKIEKYKYIDQNGTKKYKKILNKRKSQQNKSK